MDALSLIRKPIEKELSEYRVLFEKALSHDSPLLGDVLGHIRTRKGKMMRPILLLLSAKWAGGISEVSLHSAVTLEVLHTASLVHDDVVDESSKRRGQLSVNAAYNNKIAVLVGDYLLSTALVYSSFTQHIEIVEKIAGLGQTLSEGELLQLSNVAREDISEEAYYSIIRKKTAALFASCAEIGAMSANASADNVKTAFRFGELVGICCQIRDDIFDYFDGMEIGKPTGNDMHEGKLTLPAIHALKISGNSEMNILAHKVKDGHASQDEINRLVRFTIDNGGIEYARQTMENYRNEAYRILSSVPSGDLRQALTVYIDYCIDRNS